MKMISKALQFLREDIWRIRSKELSRAKAIGIRYLRLFILAVRGFVEDRVYLRASALTFFSLLSIVPVMAMAFGVAKGFGFEKRLEGQLLERFAAQEEVLVRAIEFANSLLETTKGGLVAGVGLVVLFYAIIRVLGNIESSFNRIWGVKASRRFVRKLSDYLSIMLIAPVLLIMSSSFTVFVKTGFTAITEQFELLGYLSFLVSGLLMLLPYCFIWGLFAFVYILMPNTKVQFSSAIFAGVVAGTIYQIVQFGYVTFQVGVAKYNAIYGSFAALPMFLIWLQVSWLIVLFGAEVSYAHQNVDTYEFEPDSKEISLAHRRLFTLGIAHMVIKNFSRGDPPLSCSEIGSQLGIPDFFVREITEELVRSGTFSRVKRGEQEEEGYQPALDPDLLTIGYILEALEEEGKKDLPIPDRPEFKKISEVLQGFRQAIANAPENQRLKAI